MATHLIWMDRLMSVMDELTATRRNRKLSEGTPCGRELFNNTRLPLLAFDVYQQGLQGTELLEFSHQALVNQRSLQ